MPKPVEAPEPVALPSANELMQRTLESMRIEARIAKDIESYQQRPKRRFVGARAEEYRLARYVEDWRAKIERVGNLNYPEAARSAPALRQLAADGVDQERRQRRERRDQPVVGADGPRCRGGEDRRDVGALRRVSARHQARHRRSAHHPDLDVQKGDKLHQRMSEAGERKRAKARRARPRAIEGGRQDGRRATWSARRPPDERAGRSQ